MKALKNYMVVQFTLPKFRTRLPVNRLIDWHGISVQELQIDICNQLETNWHKSVRIDNQGDTEMHAAPKLNFVFHFAYSVK